MLDNIVKVSISKDAIVRYGGVGCCAYLPRNVAEVGQFIVVNSWQQAYDYFRNHDSTVDFEPTDDRPFLDFIAGYYADNVEKPLLVPDSIFADIHETDIESANEIDVVVSMFASANNYRIDYLVLSPLYLVSSVYDVATLSGIADIAYSKGCIVIATLIDEEEYGE